MRTAQARSPKKEKLLQAAERLMLKQGYPATTVDAICTAAGVTKGGFFHYFKGKEDLGKEVLARFVAGIGLKMQTAAFRKKADPLQRVYGYIDFLTEMFRDPAAPRACLLGHFSQELADTHPAIRTQCARHFGQWAAVLAQDLEAAKTKYAPRSGIDPRGLAEHLIAVIEGSLILARASQDKKVMEKNLQHFRRYLDSLFEHR